MDRRIDEIDQRLEEICKFPKYNQKDFPPEEFMETGLDAFDFKCKGLLKGDITLFTASSGQGKSYNARRFAKCLSNDKNILYISCEETENRDLMDLCIEGTTPETLRYANLAYLGGVEQKRIMDSIFTIVKCCNDWESVIFIDGINYLLNTDYESDKEVFIKICTFFRKTAKILNIPIVITWQLNRGAAGIDLKNVNMGQIAESMNMARSAPCIIAFGRSDGNYAMKILKWRPDGKIQDWLVETTGVYRKEYSYEKENFTKEKLLMD